MLSESRTGALDTLKSNSSCNVVLQRRHLELSDSSFERFLAFYPGPREKAVRFMQRAFPYYSLSIQKPSDLETVARLNVVNAVAINAEALGVRFLDLHRDEYISPFNCHGPQPSGAATPHYYAPGALRPTIVQRTVAHHPWIDLFPIPGMRDNVIRGIDAGLIDEDNLCGDLIRLECSDECLAPLVVWGESWDARSWKFSTEFLTKWSWLIQDCPEVLEATNCWREKRGQMKFEFI